MDAHPEVKETYTGGMEAYPGVLEGQRGAVKGHPVAVETLTHHFWWSGAPDFDFDFI